MMIGVLIPHNDISNTRSSRKHQSCHTIEYSPVIIEVPDGKNEARDGREQGNDDEDDEQHHYLLIRNLQKKLPEIILDRPHDICFHVLLLCRG